jgi:hypothetical protein
MPRRGYKVKETRGLVRGGATTIIFIASADEDAHNSGKDEEIPGGAHNTSTDHYPPGKSDGINKEVTICEG